MEHVTTSVFSSRQVEVLLHTGHVRETQIDEHDLFVLEEREHFFG